MTHAIIFGAVAALMAIIVCVTFWVSERDIQRRIRARREEMERSREESRRYWAQRIEADEAQRRRETPPAPIAPVEVPVHNAGRRRMLKLD